MRYGQPRFPPGPRGNGHPGAGRFPNAPPRPMRMAGSAFRGPRPRQPFQGQRGVAPMKQKPTVPVKPTLAEAKPPTSIAKPAQAAPIQQSPVKSQQQPNQQQNLNKPPPKPQPLLQQQVTPTQRPNQGPQNRYSHQGNRNNSHQGNQSKGPSFQSDQQTWSQGSHNSGGPKKYYDKVQDRIQSVSGPQYDLPPLDMSEKKFNSSSRLFVGNLLKGVTQEEVQNLFSKFGECSIYLAKDATYAFVNFDYRANALKALRETNGAVVKGRFIQVRFAAVSEGIRVKNLSRIVSNELLEKAFSIFGLVETARVIVDDRAFTKGEAIVIFKEKKSALIALKRCQEECFIITGTARPVIVTPLESTEDNEDGYPETSVPRNDEYQSDRRHGPHFAPEGTYEHDFCLEWKKIYQALDEKKKQLDEELGYEVERLEKKMVLARVEFEKDSLRRELAAREAEAVHLRRRFGPERGFPEEPLPFSAPKRSIEPGYDNYRSGPYEGGFEDSYERGPPGPEYDAPYSRPPPYGRDGFDGHYPPERMGPPRGDYNDDFQAPKRPRY